ncbi:MAG: AMP-binding protein [Verrucomicrobiota bacterium]|jgi:phenylacetate-CoA ligase
MTALEKFWPETFRYAKRHSPFYREWFRGLKSVPTLHDLPTVDKKILSERTPEFLCVARNRIAEIVTTSGTAGKPLLWMLTKPDVERLAANEKISFACAGITPRDTVLVAVSLDRCFIAGLAYWQGLRDLGCTVVRVGASSSMLVLEMIERINPTAIVAVPSFLRVIAGKARDIKFNLQQCPVIKTVCIGEPVRDVTFNLNSSGSEIEKNWGAKVYSTYGVTELANSLCECAAGRGGHLHDEQLYLEVLDDAGRLLADGEVGEVVATTFGVEAMPLIRYRTGDCAALFTEKCRCGRKTPRIGPIIGRKHQKLKFKGTSVFPSTLQVVLEENQSVESFVIIAQTDNDLSDSIEVLFHGSASAAGLREMIQARAKIAPRIRRASAGEIEKLQMPPEARKRRTFVDLR